MLCRVTLSAQDDEIVKRNDQPVSNTRVSQMMDMNMISNLPAFLAPKFWCYTSYTTGKKLRLL
jgi:hypothetical protein